MLSCLSGVSASLQASSHFGLRATVPGCQGTVIFASHWVGDVTQLVPGVTNLSLWAAYGFVSSIVSQMTSASTALCQAWRTRALPAGSRWGRGCRPWGGCPVSKNRRALLSKSPGPWFWGSVCVSVPVSASRCHCGVVVWVSRFMLLSSSSPALPHPHSYPPPPHRWHREATQYQWSLDKPGKMPIHTPPVPQPQCPLLPDGPSKEGSPTCSGLQAQGYARGETCC